MWVFDVGDLDAIPAFVARVEAELGGIDLLVNNAGIPKRRRIPELSEDDLEEVMRVNFFAPVALVRAVLPGMLERDHGRIVNLSSMGAHSMAARVGAYAASKGALELYTEALHLDLLGTGVDAQLFVPGTSRTEFSLPARRQRPAVRSAERDGARRRRRRDHRPRPRRASSRPSRATTTPTSPRPSAPTPTPSSRQMAATLPSETRGVGSAAWQTSRPRRPRRPSGTGSTSATRSR